MKLGAEPARAARHTHRPGGNMRLAISLELAHRELVEQYRFVHGTGPFTLREVLEWGQATDRLPTQQLFRMHIVCLPEALTSEQLSDPGQPAARKWHHTAARVRDAAGRVVQAGLWGDIVTCGRGFFKKCTRHRARLIQMDVAALRRDVDYKNELLRADGKPVAQATFACESSPNRKGNGAWGAQKRMKAILNSPY
jgi:hypothetical protein